MLSAVIITKNEETNIQDCLKSIKWVDEIILVDAESSDATREIASKYTKNILVTPWKGYALNKNFGLKEAQGDWILSIDADERVTGELQQEIQTSIKKNTKTGYYIPRTLFFCGKKVKHGGCFPDYQLRLFKKEFGRFENTPVHEKIILKGKVGYLKNPLNHYSYKNIADYWTRFNIYTSLDAVKKQENREKFSIFSILLFFLDIFKRLVLKKGILDGIPGIFYHIFSSVSLFVKNAKLWELNENIRK